MKRNFIISGGKKLEIGRMTPTFDRIFLDAKNNNELKFDKKGSNFNGYGYQDWDYFFIISPRYFSKIKKILKIPKKEIKIKSEKQKKEIWARRLAKLSGITFSEALDIASEKEEYKEKQIEELESRQCEHYSVKRESLKGRIERSNPLRHITNREHALAILEASNRHRNTNYDEKLREARELVKTGDIDYSEVRDFALRNKKNNW